MKYFVETRVVRNDKKHVVERVAAPSYHHAQCIAWMIAKDAFTDQYDPGMSFEFGLSPIFTNDYGETTQITVMAYPDMAQVKPGKYEQKG